MAKSISNMKELEKVLQPVLLGMVDELSERVYETLNYFLQEYYNSYDPESYQRTKDFLYSAVKVKAKMSGNKAVVSVFIDTDAMDNYYNIPVRMYQWKAYNTLERVSDTGDVGFFNGWCSLQTVRCACRE